MQRGEAAAHLADGRPGAAEDDGAWHAGLQCPGKTPEGRLARCAPKPPPPPLPTPAPTRSSIGLFDGEAIAHDVDGGVLQALVDSGEAKPGLRKLAVTHAGGKRYVLAGLGKREEFDAERARVAAASVAGRAREIGARFLCWELPHHVGDAEAGGFVEGTLLAAYAYRAHKSKPAEDGGIEQLALSAHHDVVGGRRPRRRRGRRPTNAARDLQNAPANELTPTRLAERAHELAAELGTLTVETMGRAEIEAAGMGAFAGVARGSHEEPQLITLRYAPDGRRRPRARPRRQGRDVRLRRHLDQARHEDERDEVRHVRRRGRARGHRGDRPARAARPGRGRDRRDREPARRVTRSSRATSCAPRPARRSRSSTPTPRAGSCWPTASRTRSSSAPSAWSTSRRSRARSSPPSATPTPACSAPTTRGARRSPRPGRRAGELIWRLPLHPDYAKAIEGRYADIVNVGRDPQGRLDRRGRVPQALHRRRAVGARRHRRHRLGHRQGLRAQGRRRASGCG